MIRRLILAAAGLALAAGTAVLPAAAASAWTNPHPANHCPLWANYHLFRPYPHCYANGLRERQ